MIYFAMGIYDRDWYRERPNNRSFFTGNDLKLAILAFLVVVLSLVLKYYVLPRIPSPVSYVKPPVLVHTPPAPVHIPSAPVHVPLAPISSVQNRSRVIYSTSTSQTIQYYKKGGVKYIEAEINGVPIEVMIDTGASYVSLDSATVQKLGITSFLSKGVSNTAGGLVDVYMFRCASVRVGTMEVKNIDCSYLPTLSGNLLGGSFLSHFSYSFNEEDNTITLTCNDCSLETLPLGIVEINGKKYLYYSSGQLVEVQ